MIDLLITNGRVADGTGNPLRRADLAIDDGRIVGVGRLAGTQATRTIDADGRLVAPGFVDPHSHSDRTILVNPRAESTIRQGVTTEIVGNCGMTLAPVTDESRSDVEGALDYFGYEGGVEWGTLGELMAFVHERGISPNFGWLMGHNALRAAVGGTSSPVNDDQLARMREFMDEAMRAGALGLSTGLEFRPGTWASTEEIIEINKVVGAYGGIYASHVRNRDSQLRQSTEEFLRIVREGGTRGEYSHLNVRHNSGADPGAWQETVDMLAAAREEGLEVLADTTPFLDGLGRMAGILPTWLIDQPPADVVRDLRDPEIRARLKTDCDRYWRFIHKGEWHRVRLLGSPSRPELNGMNFTEIAKVMGGDEWDAFFDLIADAGEAYDDMTMIGRLFTDEHMADMISQPLFSLGVDCWTSTTEAPLGELVRHPVSYAGHVHYLTHHVATQGTLRLEEAIRKMTSMPAAHFGLHDRGLLRDGFAADLSIIDLDRLDDVSTLEDPVHYVQGVDHVFVNGVSVVEDGEHTGALPGVQLRSR
jgi:N-acyl-D-amino-acid deacylase